MRDMNFPTVDPADPLRLTDEEEELLHTLELSFRHNARLHEHVRFLYSNGSMYKCCNSNLLYHGCIPMTENREFDGLMVGGKMYRGKELMDFIDTQVKNAYFFQRTRRRRRRAAILCGICGMVRNRRYLERTKTAALSIISSRIRK